MKELGIIITMRVSVKSICQRLEANSELAEENFSVLQEACRGIQIPDACIAKVKNFENGDVAFF